MSRQCSRRRVGSNIADEPAGSAQVELMNRRLPEVGRRELELYLSLLGKLAVKLEQGDKSLHTAAQEVFAEVATLVMTELGR